jgi:6,7-dimethyl-8-ribityllumazine synthase
MRLAIVAARFNAAITERLLEGAVDALQAAGAAARAIEIFRVPGCFELPLMAKSLALTGQYDGVIALGAVIRGETPHFEYVSSATARGLMQVALETDVPVGFGVLTTDTYEQAAERAGGALGNKGADTALTIVETATALGLQRFSP